MADIPNKMRAYVMEKADGKPGQVYHPASVKDVPVPKLEQGHVLIKLQAGALNHRDLFSRRGMYPGLIFPSILGADGTGIVVAPSSSQFINKRVIFNSASGWDSDPDGPESPDFGIYGGVKQTKGAGTFAEYIAVPEKLVVNCPAHLSPAEAAAFPLGGLTAWRAVFTKAKVRSGQNVLVTGIGGGVAIQALQYCVAIGAKVWVTSGSAEKIEQAKKLGAEGGVNYKDEKWPQELAKLLPKDRPFLDVVVDSAGGKIAIQVLRILKTGGSISCYGSTTGQEMPINSTLINPNDNLLQSRFATVSNVLKNHQFLGSTMGSNDEFKESVAFIDKHRIVPVVHTVFSGLDECEKLFKTMDEGSQFGKLVVEISKSGSSSKL